MGRKLAAILLVLVVGLSSFGLIPRAPPGGRELLAEHRFQGLLDALSLSPANLWSALFINVSGQEQTQLGGLLLNWSWRFSWRLGTPPRAIFMALHESENFFGLMSMGNQTLRLGPGLNPVEQFDNLTVLGGPLDEFGGAWMGYILEFEPVIFGALPLKVDQPSFLRQVVHTMLSGQASAAHQPELIQLIQQLGNLEGLNWCGLELRIQLENSTRGYGMGVWIRDEHYLLKLVMPRIQFEQELTALNFSSWDPIQDSNLSLNFSLDAPAEIPLEIDQAKLKLNLSGFGNQSKLILSFWNRSEQFWVPELAQNLTGMLELDLSEMMSQAQPRIELEIQVQDWIQIAQNSTPQLMLKGRLLPNQSNLEFRRSQAQLLGADYRYQIQHDFLVLELEGGWEPLVSELRHWGILG